MSAVDAVAGDASAVDALLRRVGAVVSGRGRMNANKLAALYRSDFGCALDFKSLGFGRLGALLDLGNGVVFDVERTAATFCDLTGAKVRNGELFLRPLADAGDDAGDDDAEPASQPVGSAPTCIVGFYYYANPRWGESARDAAAAVLHAVASRHGMRGRVRVACEGVNASVSGCEGAAYARAMADLDGWGSVRFHVEAAGARAQWRALQVWTAAELCGLGCDAAQQVALDAVGPGTKLSPEDFAAKAEAVPPEAVSGERPVLIDVRNAYETCIGRFVPPEGGASFVDPRTRNFSDMSAWVDGRVESLAGRDVLMYCTGGVRCERATAVVRAKLRSVGADDSRVFHLDGGVVNWMRERPNAAPGALAFRGANYVFDRRANDAHPRATKDVLGRCLVCAEPCDVYRNRRCHACTSAVLVCDGCISRRQDANVVLTCELCREEPPQPPRPPQQQQQQIEVP
ncbi:hypothetical protein M885DRAFT_504555 [Pelagophyceae sp. CCMP2097]|nr:hypothetical protein M885DRAFT_504555 [Pelagophyceae sp. CCMP2097]